jgi:4a-hydroxytetrahydrobiopterin dehydratase
LTFVDLPITLAPVTKLSDDEIDAVLAGPALEGWRREDGWIVKEFRYRDFREAMAFINRMARLADRADHHPDFTNHYNRVRVALRTWTEHGVTERDVALAREIEGVATPPP